jgi:stage V sporulation protein G
MKVSKINLNKIAEAGSKILAFGSIILDDALKCDIRLVQGSKGNFVSFPSFKGKDGYKETCHPVAKGLRKHISDEVSKAYAALA